MGPGSASVPDETLERIKEGLNTYFTPDAVDHLLDALNVEALIENTAIDDAVGSEEMGKVLGQIIGRAVVKELTSYIPLGQVIEMMIGEEIGKRLGETAVVTFLEYSDPEAVVDRVRTVTEREDSDITHIVGDIQTVVQESESESEIRDHVPGLGFGLGLRDTLAGAHDPDDVTHIEITDETNTEH